MASLRFKIDENLPTEVVTLLKGAGHDTKSVLDQALGGATDVRLVELCRAENRVIVTLAWMSPAHALTHRLSSRDS